MPAIGGHSGTRQHSRLGNLLSVKQICAEVNKMDCAHTIIAEVSGCSGGGEDDGSGGDGDYQKYVSQYADSQENMQRDAVVLNMVAERRCGRG